MREIAIKRIADFDRSIKLRNRTETVAAFLVTAFFGFAAFHQQTSLERLGSAVVASSGLWIAWYVYRHGSDEVEPDPNQPVESYRHDLSRKYDHQIKLLRTVKLWYLLPMYVGLLISTAGMTLKQNRPLTWIDALAPLFYTAVFAVVWWLNEVHAVRKLRKLKAEIVED